MSRISEINAAAFNRVNTVINLEKKAVFTQLCKVFLFLGNNYRIYEHLLLFLTEMKPLCI